MNDQKTRHPLTLHAVALAAALCAAGSATGGEIETGNPDLVVRFDNTVKYNLARRTEKQDASLLKSANFDDGDRNFDKGLVSNRLDILSEFDVVWEKKFGMRMSAAGWTDFAYRSLDNTNVASSNHLVAGKPALGLSPYSARYHKGASGEILDAFMFGNFDVADMPVNVKVGRHTLYWGESLLSPIHGANYGQSAIDLIKGYSVPGTEAKELLLPRAAVSAQVSPSSELAIAAQYFMQWKPARLPEAGSYLGFNDFGFQGGESYNLGALGVAQKMDDRNAKKHGDFGVTARWSPDWLDGTLGFIYRQTSDLLPQANLRLAGLPSALFGQSSPLVAQQAQAAAAAVIAGGGTPAQAAAAAQQAGAATAVAVGNATCTAAIPGAMVVPGAAATGPNCAFYPAALGATSRYQLEYASNIDVFGMSLSKSVAGVSVGADLTYRRHMPLNSSAAVLMPVGTAAPLVGALNATLGGQTGGAMVVKAAALPGEGDTSGARGDTWHGVLNFLGTTAQTPLFDGSSWIVEFQWNRWQKVTEGAELFKGRAGYDLVDRVSKNFVGVALNFTPTWFQVFPGVDLSAPIAYTRGLSGNSAVNSGGNKGGGNYSAGLSFDIYQKYKIDVKYVDFFGKTSNDATGGIGAYAGVTGLLKDRGFVAVTLKTTF